MVVRVRQKMSTDLADGSAGQGNGHAWEIEGERGAGRPSPQGICSASIGIGTRIMRGGLYLEVMPAKEGQG